MLPSNPAGSKCQVRLTDGQHLAGVPGLHPGTLLRLAVDVGLLSRILIPRGCTVNAARIQDHGRDRWPARIALRIAVILEEIVESQLAAKGHTLGGLEALADGGRGVVPRCRRG